MILLNSTAFKRRYDSDAQTYFAALSAASSSINDNNKSAVNVLISGLKLDGIWPLIKELYLYAGPSNLNGALVKAKGTGIRTNTGFLSTDFSETLGLQGGGTKYINNNFSTSSLSNTSNSIFVYSSSGFQNSGDITLTGAWSGGGLGTSLFILDAYSTYVSARAFRSGTYTSGQFPVINTGLITSGSILGTRTSANLSKIYQNGLESNSNTTTVNPSFSNNNIFSFTLNQGGTPSINCSTDRRQVEAIGDGLTDNQALLLHNRVATYVASLWSYDSDAQTYFSALTAAGSSISENNKIAVNSLFLGLKSDGIWSLIKELYLYAGPNTLNGALVKARGSGTRVNNGFVSGDFSPTLGLQGNGAKYIRNGFMANSLPSLSHSIFVYSSSGLAVSGNEGLSGAIGQGPSTLILEAFRSNDSPGRRFESGSYTNGQYANSSIGLTTSGSILGSRISSTSSTLYQNGLILAFSSTNITPALDATTMQSFGFLFNGNSNLISSDRRQVEAFAEGLNDTQASQLHNRVAVYVSNIQAY